MTGSFVTGTDCEVSSTSNTGCGVRASQTNSYGAAFNSINGGMYAGEFYCRAISLLEVDDPLAALWDSTGWKVWFFPRSSIPSDLSNGAPLPATWGKPMANFPSTSCDAFKYFYQHSVVFDTTLWYAQPLAPALMPFSPTCANSGQWGDGVWGSDNAPGQAQTCAQRTGVASCEDFVRGNGASFSEACE